MQAQSPDNASTEEFLPLSPHRFRLRLLLTRSVIFAFIWWAISDGVMSAWWMGLPAVVLATTASAFITPPAPVHWRKLPAFVPFFISRSLLGGFDVARRVFLPSMPLCPALVEYHLRLENKFAKVILLNTISLLPGTLSADLHGNKLLVHTLDSNRDTHAELEQVEAAVAQLCGDLGPEQKKQSNR